MEFGSLQKTDNDFISEIKELVGRDFPMTISVVNGKLIYFSYNTEIKIGGTTPIEVEEDYQVPTGELDENELPIYDTFKNTIVTGYEEDYSVEHLTPEQIEIINTWAEQNVEG